MGIPRKWEKGEAVWGHADFEVAVRARKVMYVRGFFKGRPTSSVMVSNMSYTMVRRLILTGAINIAVQREEYRRWLRVELLGPEPEVRLLGP